LSKRREAVVFVVACLLVMTMAPRASAQNRATAQLDFALDGGVTGCPSESAFRERVTVRLGYDPFVDASSSRVHVRFTRRGGRLDANVAIEDDGRAVGTRKLEEAATRCDVLFDAVAATIAIALDPVTRKPREETAGTATPTPNAQEATSPPPAAAALPSPPPAEQPTTAPERSPTVRPYALLDGLASTGVAPGATLGAQAGVGLHRAAFVIAAEGRVETTPSAADLSSGDRVTASVFFAGVVPCLRVGVASLCLGGRIGSLQATSRDVTRPALKSSFIAAAFARAAAVLPLGGAFAFRAGVEASVPLIRTTLSVDGEAIWIAPPVNGSLLAGIEWAPP
jgi:hypothetical protein